MAVTVNDRGERGRIRPPISLYYHRLYTVSVAAVSTRILTADPTRVSIVWASHTASPYYVFPEDLGTAGEGLRINGASQPLIMSWQDFAAAINGEWWVRSTGGTFTVRMIEVLAV